MTDPIPPFFSLLIPSSPSLPLPSSRSCPLTPLLLRALAPVSPMARQYDLSALWYKYQEEKKEKIAAGRAAAKSAVDAEAVPAAGEAPMEL